MICLPCQYTQAIMGCAPFPVPEMEDVSTLPGMTINTGGVQEGNLP